MTHSIEIPIVIDAINEGQEQFFVQLSNPSGGATLGSQAMVPAIIIENPVSSSVSAAPK